MVDPELRPSASDSKALVLLPLGQWPIISWEDFKLKYLGSLPVDNDLICLRLSPGKDRVVKLLK